MPGNRPATDTHRWQPPCNHPETRQRRAHPRLGTRNHHHHQVPVTVSPRHPLRDAPRADARTHANAYVHARARARPHWRFLRVHAHAYPTSTSVNPAWGCAMESWCDRLGAGLYWCAKQPCARPRGVRTHRANIFSHGNYHCFHARGCFERLPLRLDLCARTKSLLYSLPSRPQSFL